MMDKRTLIPVQKRSFSIDYSSNIVLLGSCFSSAMGSRLTEMKFNALTNPFGTVFNPVSIAQLLKFEKVNPNKIVQRDDVFFHYDYHSEVHGYSSNEITQEIESRNQTTQDFLKEATQVFITLGTSWVFECENEVVNNCHKQDKSLFNRRLLSLSEIEKALSEIVSSIHQINKEIEIVFTVSPVRHVKNGLIDNNRSKALLLVALEHVLGQNVSYFESYELILDDLRDYQYYSADLIHPTKEAEDYVFGHFIQTYCTVQTQQKVNKIKSLLARENHRPQFEKSKEWQEFQVKLKDDIEKFLKQNKDISW